MTRINLVEEKYQKPQTVFSLDNLFKVQYSRRPKKLLKFFHQTLALRFHNTRLVRIKIIAHTNKHLEYLPQDLQYTPPLIKIPILCRHAYHIPKSSTRKLFCADMHII